ncbi:MAG: SAM-dependent methyltransferase, partial [Calditrichaeota bacterium]
LVCFGNTLAHLASLHEMNDFLQQAHSLLRPNGHIFLQIVNFNRILDQGIHSLPLIDNDHVRFERFYAHRNSQNLIDFRTILTVKSNNIKIENVTALYPLQRDELEGLLQKTGFQNIRFFGTFAKNTWTNTRMATIVEATN